MAIYLESNAIRLTGAIESGDIFRFAQLAYIACVRKGFGEVILDFSNVASVFQTFMVPAVALCRNYMGKKHTFEIIQPHETVLKSLFHNSNWNHLLNPTINGPTTFVGTQHMPAQAYRNGTEQHALVNKLIDIILGSLILQRKQLAALEWSINEITDNVLNHAQSTFGGVIQATTYAMNNSVEFVVADAGIGIPQSLRERDERQALTKAIQEGVTRDKLKNQGNGLYGSFRVATISGGRFEVHSSHASLISSHGNQIRVTTQPVRKFPGTCVISRILCNDENLIEQALVFQGRLHQPGNDYFESHYERETGSEYEFVIKNEAPGFGTREAGRIVQNKVMNLLRADGEHFIVIDFGNYPLDASTDLRHIGDNKRLSPCPPSLPFASSLKSSPMTMHA